MWFVTFSVLCKKNGIRNTGVLYFGFYTLINILALHYYNNNDEGDVYVGQHLLFLIYLFVFIYLFCKPLVKSDRSNRFLVKTKQRQITILCIFVAGLSLVGITDIIKEFYTGIFMLASDDGYGATLYQELRMSMDESKSGVANYIAVFTNIARSISPIFLFIYLTFNKKNIAVVVALIFASLTLLLHAVSTGSRSAIIDGMLNFGFMFFYMWKYYSASLKKVLFPLIVACSIVFMSGFIFITISRSLRNNLNPIGFVEKYLAISPLNFGKYGLDNGEIRYGDRTLPLFKSLFTDNVARTYAMRIDKYTSMKINESTFSTFISDFIFDYGVVLGTLVLLLIIFLFNKGINSPPHNVICYHHIVLIYLLMNFLNGYYLYTMSDYLGNLKLLFLVLLYFYLKRGTNAVYK
jgi:oligosaccharide repeat unit polymerase